VCGAAAAAFKHLYKSPGRAIVLVSAALFFSSGVSWSRSPFILKIPFCVLFLLPSWALQLICAPSVTYDHSSKCNQLNMAPEPPQYPEKAAAPPSPSSSSYQPPNRRGLSVNEAERRQRRMATIQDDDERLLMRIGYKQVCAPPSLFPCRN
jgi:hypothetical protein